MPYSPENPRSEEEERGKEAKEGLPSGVAAENLSPSAQKMESPSSVVEKKKDRQKKIEHVREELREMHHEGTHKIPEQPHENMSDARKALGEYLGVPLNVVSTKALRETADERWNTPERYALQEELERRAYSSAIRRVFGSITRGLRRIPYGMKKDVKDTVLGMKSMHFEDRTPEEAQEIREKLKRANPLLSLIVEEHENRKDDENK